MQCNKPKSFGTVERLKPRLERSLLRTQTKYKTGRKLRAAQHRATQAEKMFVGQYDQYAGRPEKIAIGVTISRLKAD